MNNLSYLILEASDKMAARGGEIFLLPLLPLTNKFSSVMELGWWLFRLPPSEAFKSTSLLHRKLDPDVSLSDKARASSRPVTKDSFNQGLA